MTMNNGPGIRIGIVSTIDYENGLVSVKYDDLNNSVTAKMPYLSMNSEYKMPRIDDTVLVLYLSNGSSIGIVIGSFWNKKNKPPVNGKDVYYKELASEIDITCINGELVIKAPKIKVITDTGEKEL
jgi:phage baseplate assembly protein gpV